MELFQLVCFVFFNKAALQYALCVACIFAPLYAFVLKPVVRALRRRGAADAVPAAPPQPIAASRNSPVRLSTASSNAFRSPASLGATPLPVTPIFSPVSHASASRSRSKSGGGTAPSVLPPLELSGTPVHVAAEEYRSPTQRFVSLLRHQVQQRGAAIFGNESGAVRAAVETGEVYIHRPPRNLPSLDYLAQRLLQRQKQHALYDELDITEPSLEALYASPKFQEWYSANREELLRDARLRKSFYLWRSVARAVVLLTAVLLLPAFSFSTQTTATQWWTSLTAGDSAATVAAAPFAQILLTRMNYIQDVRSSESVAGKALPFASRMRPDVRTLAASVVSSVEWVAVVAAACSLVTSCFMPRGSRRTASVALASFLIVLIESVLVAGVSLRLGFGFLLILVVVGTSIRRAAE